jgi:FKBP-type peptidyl-prolyl cis-trans isomerase SlyD
MKLMVAPNMVVTVHYTLRDGSAEGEEIESTYGSSPLVYLSGQGMMIPLFEKNLGGKFAGDTFAFAIPSDEAYGPYSEEDRVELPKATFGLTPEQEAEFFVPGRVLPLQDQDGTPLDGLVVAINDEMVVIDFNHFMAGVNLYFTGEIVEVRVAEPEELAHGHVHGEGGHHH